MPLEQLVREYLLRSLESLGYRIVESVESQHFDNAECVLASPPVRARIVRERSQFFLDVGPPSDPSLWYDSAVVMEFLGLSRDAGFHDSDTNRVLTGMATFLQSFQHELSAAFAAEGLAETKRQLDVLRAKRADTEFGR